MFTGWPLFGKFYKINRPLTDKEVEERLEVQYGNAVPMHSQLVLRLNGTFLEVADRTQHHRGGFGLLFATLFFPSIGLIAPIGVLILSIGKYLSNFIDLSMIYGSGTGTSLVDLLFAFVMTGCWIWFGFYKLCWPFIKFNLTGYRYYPRRFNRKNRQVYAFNLDGSVTKLSFDKIFWNIGHGGARDYYLTDIRGHEVDEKGIIRYTFNAGPYFGLNQESETLDVWRFICRYMDKGEASVAENDYDRVILRTYRDVSWTSSLRFQYMRTHDMIWKPLLPLHLLTAAFHLLCMKLSKQPEWPEWVEKECALDPADPPAWKEPEHNGDPVFDHPDPDYIIYSTYKSGDIEEAEQMKRDLAQGTFQQKMANLLAWKPAMLRFTLYVAVFFAGVYLYDLFYG